MMTIEKRTLGPAATLGVANARSVSGRIAALDTEAQVV
jgi:hypothetical protein